MLDKKQFEKNLSVLLAFKNVKENKMATDLLYNFVKNDFTDDQFGEFCVDICKTEDLYNKYPDPRLFYDRKQQKENSILVEVGAFYIDENDPEYKEALIGCNDRNEMWKLCDAVWDWVYKNKRGELVSKRFIADRIKQFNPYGYRQQEKTLEMNENVTKLLTGSIKKV